MTSILSFLMSGATAWAVMIDGPPRPIYPSGFRPQDCRSLLEAGATMPSLTAFKKMAVREKIRDVHTLAFIMGRAMEQSNEDVMDKVAQNLLATALYSTFGTRLQFVAEVEGAQLVDYAAELREVSFNLLGLGAVSEHLEAALVHHLWNFSKMVIELPYQPGQKVAHNWRALTYLTLALVESDLARRYAAPMKLLISSFENLKRAETEDAQGDRGDVAFSGLAEVFDRLIAVSADLSANDLENIDEEAMNLLNALTKPFAEGAPKPPHFADLARGLADTADAISDEELPLLADALADFARRFTAAQNLN